MRTCRALLESRGWTLLHVYNDRALSGSSTLRPGYQRMLEDARAGQFDVIVAEALDRLSRDQADVAGLYKQLRFLEIGLVTAAEGEINELHVGLKGTMNALFLKDLAQKTKRGMEGRVRDGKSAGGLAYGYNVVKELDGAGNPVRGKRAINEAEAAIVRRIFEEYVAGRSPRAIARGLNTERFPSPSGKAWGVSTINGSRKRGTGILNNELYIGRLIWNRQRFIKDPATGKRITKVNPPEAWVIEEVPELRIVTHELWEAAMARKDDQQSVSERMSRAATVRYWDRRRPRYLLSGLLRCGSCGGGYSKISAHQFGCPTARDRGTRDNRLNIRRDVLEATVLDGLRTRLMDPGLFKAFAEEFTVELNRHRKAEIDTHQALEGELVNLDRKIARIVEAITSGVDALALKDELLGLESRRKTYGAAWPRYASPSLSCIQP